MDINLTIRALVIALSALLVNAAVRSAIRRFFKGSQNGSIRIRGVALFLDRTSSLFFAGVAAIMILDVFSLDTRPLLTGIGIASLLVTFGAQAVLKDVFSGFFIFFEDLYGEGDTVTLDEVSGKVYKLTLRKTVLLDNKGKLHHIPHGSVKVVSIIPPKRKT